MISVKVGRIHGNASLITFIDTLSAPGALFEGNERTMYFTYLKCGNRTERELVSEKGVRIRRWH